MVAFLAAAAAKYTYAREAARIHGDSRVGEVSGELIGEERVGEAQALHSLKRIYLPGAGIDSAGHDRRAVKEIGKCVFAAEELDLSANPLRWQDVLLITAQLPLMHWISLDESPLCCNPLPLRDVLGASFRFLHSLSLCRTGLSWASVLAISGATPLLRELQFNNNGLGSLRCGEIGNPITNCHLGRLGANSTQPLIGLRALALENNNLRSWDALLPLSFLPSLELLNLNGNAIAQLPIPICGFASLRRLLLRGNALADWNDVVALSGLPRLREARLSDLPLTAPLSAALARRLLIGRLPGVRALNGSQVRIHERDDAERFYLRQMEASYPTPLPPFSDHHVPSTNGRDLAELHPRRRRLLVRYGKHAAIAERGVIGPASNLASELIEVLLRATAAEGAALPAAKRNLPACLPIKSVKLIAFQLFKVEPAMQLLLYTPPGQEAEIPEPLDDDRKRLCDFAVVNGGTIVVGQIHV